MNCHNQTKNSLATASALALAMLVVGPLSDTAHAGKADAFLSSLQGEWRGRGTVRISSAKKKTRVSCVIKSVLKKSSRQLVNTGRCATAQGKSRVSGTLKYSKDGEKLDGVFFSSTDGVKVTRSSGVISGNTMVLTANLLEVSIGKISKSRSTIKRFGKNKYTLSISIFENGKWSSSGSISFKK